jgi:hypothetical protein
MKNDQKVRTRVVNGEFWTDDDEVVVSSMEAAITAARAFLGDSSAAVERGDLSEGYTAADIEFVWEDGSVMSMTAILPYADKTVEELAQLLSDYSKDVHGVRQRQVSYGSILRSLVGLDAYMALMESTPEGRERLCDDGWVIRDDEVGA